MKNIYKITLGIIFTIGTLTSCDKNINLEPEDDASLKMSEVESAEFFKQNISIFDARIRSISESEFAKELYLANFSDTPWDKTEVGFEGGLFKDDGKGNDLTANDQIYTSVKSFAYNKNISFDKNFPLKSVMSNSIISPEFKHHSKLEQLSNKYRNSIVIGNLNAKTAEVSITCDVEICSTGCIADWIWSGFGCICVSNCSVTIGF